MDSVSSLRARVEAIQDVLEGEALALRLARWKGQQPKPTATEAAVAAGDRQPIYDVIPRGGTMRPLTRHCFAVERAISVFVLVPSTLADDRPTQQAAMVTRCEAVAAALFQAGIEVVTRTSLPSFHPRTSRWVGEIPCVARYITDLAAA